MKKKDLSIIIAHYLPLDNKKLNPLIKTLESINNQKNNYNIEIIIADDGSDYTKDIIDSFSKKKSIKDDKRDIYILNNNKLEVKINKYIEKINKKFLFFRRENGKISQLIYFKQ